MVLTINNDELESIVDSCKREWGINASIKEADFSRSLPKAECPSNGIISFPKRISFNLLLFHLVQKGWNSRNELFFGNHLINLNEMIVVALRINDIESAEELKKQYFEILKEYSELVLSYDNLECNLRNAMLFFLYHELTHVRKAQQPLFYEEKKKELAQRVNNAQPAIKRSMKRNLTKLKYLEEEVICDIEACKKLHETKNNQSEFKETLLDIVHLINLTNSISNLRDKYTGTAKPSICSYFELTHSESTKTSISRFTFIQNYWKKDLMLNGKDLMRDIVSTAISLSLNQKTIDFCRAEFKKDNEGFIKYDEKAGQKAKIIKEETRWRN